MTIHASYIAPDDYDNQVETDRKVLEYLFGGLPGNNAGGVSGVILASNQSGEDDSGSAFPGVGHTAEITTGMFYLDGRNAVARQGGYLMWMTEKEIIGLPNPKASPFIATIIARVVDSQYGSITGTQGGMFQVVEGGTASDPVPVSDAVINALGIPGGWTRVSDIRINPADTGVVPAAQFTDKRTLLPNRPGDPISCTSTTRPPLVQGRMIFERNTRRLLMGYSKENIIDSLGKWVLIQAPQDDMYGVVSVNAKLPPNTAFCVATIVAPTDCDIEYHWNGQVGFSAADAEVGFTWEKTTGGVGTGVTDFLGTNNVFCHSARWVNLSSTSRLREVANGVTTTVRLLAAVGTADPQGSYYRGRLTWRVIPRIPAA